MAEIESVRYDASPTEAAEYLLRQGRPGTDDEQVRRVAGSLIVDPHYRTEIARDATTRLTESVDIAMGILARSDRQRERDAAAAPAPQEETDGR